MSDAYQLIHYTRRAVLDVHDKRLDRIAAERNISENDRRLLTQTMGVARDTLITMEKRLSEQSTRGKSPEFQALKRDFGLLASDARGLLEG